MPRNAVTGAYEDVNNSWAPAIAGTPIDPTDWNTQYSDFATTFGTDSLDRTGKGAMQANLDHGAFSSLYTEIATPTNPSANILKVYAKDVSTVTKLAILDSAGTETILGSGTVTSVSGTANRITVTGTTTTVIDISASYVGQSSITTLGTIGTGVWQGTAVGAGFGGTGQSTYAVGDLLYASASTTLSKLADVAAGSYLRSGGVTTAPVWSTTTLPNSATTGDILQASASNVYSNLNSVSTGNALISGGVGTANSWGKIGLTTHVSGTLPVANGGTNASSASITAFNNITGYTASGATGTTSTNLVFSTSPTITTPTVSGTLTGQGLIDISGASAGQIKFPATANPSADVNTLDDYEEGTTTPTPTAGSGTFTTVSSTIHYTKVGRRVFFDCNVVITTNGSAAGRIIVTLPFTNGGLIACGGGFNSSTAVFNSGFIAQGASVVEIYKYDGTYPGASGQTVSVSGAYDIS